MGSCIGEQVPSQSVTPPNIAALSEVRTKCTSEMNVDWGPKLSAWPSDQISGKPGSLVPHPPPCCPPGWGPWACVKAQRRGKTHRKGPMLTSSTVPWPQRLMSRASLLRGDGTSIHSPGSLFPSGCAPVEDSLANQWAIQHWECPSLSILDISKVRERQNRGMMWGEISSGDTEPSGTRGACR